MEAQPEDGHLGAYKPPKIAQAHLLTPCWRLVASLTPRDQDFGQLVNTDQLTPVETWPLYQGDCLDFYS